MRDSFIDVYAGALHAIFVNDEIFREAVDDLIQFRYYRMTDMAQNRDSGCYLEVRAASPPPPQHSQDQDSGRYSKVRAASLPPPLQSQHSQNQDSGCYSEARTASLPPQPMPLTPPTLLYSEAAERRPLAVGRGRGRGRGRGGIAQAMSAPGQKSPEASEPPPPPPPTIN